MGRIVGNSVSFFGPDVNEKPTNVKMGYDIPTSHKQVSRRISASSGGIKLFRYVKTTAAKAICFVTKRRATSTKGPSSSSVMDVVPQQQWFVPHRDSHQYENLEDCIEFINSSCRKSI